LKVFLYRILCGFFLGISVVAPGFSGSIVALAMGIYHDLLRIISDPFKNLKQNVLFCIPVGIGVIVSAALFMLTFRALFDAYEKAAYLLFVGLVAGNIPIVSSEVRKNGFKARYIIGAAIAFLAALAAGVFAQGAGMVYDAGAATMSEWRGLTLGGFLAGVTALIPGMSISTVLILLGIYRPLIYAGEALVRLDLAYLLPVGLFIICTIVGLALTARGIRRIFKKYPGFANTTVLGFVCGSLLGILYQGLQIDDPGFTWLLGAVMLAVGLGLSMLFIFLGKFVNKSDATE